MLIGQIWCQSPCHLLCDDGQQGLCCRLATGRMVGRLACSLRILPQTLDPGGPHILTLNIYYHFLVILLYRPFYQRQGTLSDGVINQTAIRRCNSAR